METVTETTQAETSTQPQDTQTQTQTQEDSFDPAKIDPKVSEYFEKKYSDYTTVKGELENLKGWVQAQKEQAQAQQGQSRQAPKFEISPEDYQAALADPKKFQEILDKHAQFTYQNQYVPMMAQAQYQQQVNEANRNLDRVRKENPEFDEFNKRGLIEAELRRYPNISFDDALNLAKMRTGWVDQEADRRSKGLVEKRKNAITERPGNSNAGKSKRQFANREAAMDYVLEQARLGRQVDADELEIA